MSVFGIRLLTIGWLVAALAVLTGCTPGSSTASAPPAGEAGQTGTQAQIAYTDLTPAELNSMLDNKDFFLVDTHVPLEGRLPQTDARVPFDQVKQQIGKFPSDKNAKIVLTCRSGRMSSEASQTLVELGYTNVYNLNGGMEAWKQAGYEIVPEGQ